MDNALPPEHRPEDPTGAGQRSNVPIPGPAPSPRRPPWLVPCAAGLVAGLVVGVLVGAFPLGGRTAGGSADGDAAVACEYVTSISDDDDVDLEQLALEDPVIWRLQAVGSLAMAAAQADEHYEELGQQGKDLLSAVARLDTELLTSTVQAMADGCDAR